MDKIVKGVLIIIILLALIYGGVYFVRSKQASNSKNSDQATYTSCLNFYKTHPNTPSPADGYPTGVTPGPICIVPGTITDGFLELPRYNTPVPGIYN